MTLCVIMLRNPSLYFEPNVIPVGPTNRVGDISIIEHSSQPNQVLKEKPNEWKQLYYVLIKRIKGNVFLITTIALTCVPLITSYCIKTLT